MGTFSKSWPSINKNKSTGNKGASFTKEDKKYNINLIVNI